MTPIPRHRPPQPEPGKARWFALYTRGRHEKKVDVLLRQRGFDVYLPLVPRERQWHDRTKVVPFPLFPSYVFVRSTREMLGDALRTPGAVTVVRFNGRPVPIAEEEIQNIRRFTVALAESEQEPEAGRLLDEGEAVRIVGGPFQEVEGRVLELRGNGRVLVQVGIEVIRQAMKIEVEEEVVESLEASPQPDLSL